MNFTGDPGTVGYWSQGRHQRLVSHSDIRGWLSRVEIWVYCYYKVEMYRKFFELQYLCLHNRVNKPRSRCSCDN